LIIIFVYLTTFYIQAALARYKKMRGNAPERLVSGSDDFTMFLWEPTISKQPKARMTGHQKVKFLRLLDLENVLVLVYIASACIFIP
jgi:hypothetical protein